MVVNLHIRMHAGGGRGMSKGGVQTTPGGITRCALNRHCVIHP